MMAEEQKTPDEETPKKSKTPLILGVVLALAGGGGGFYVTWSGMILADDPAAKLADNDAEHTVDSLDDVAFVEIEPLTISVNARPDPRLLRFRAQLEVPKAYKQDVAKLLPRVVDVLNSYLRALEVSDLEDQSALTRLRAQMLRRVQVVTGQERVNDFLIMEFVLT